MLQHLQKCISFSSYNDGMWRFPAVSASFNANTYNLQPISLETHPLHFSKLKSNFFPWPMKSDSEIKSTTNYFMSRKQGQAFPPHTTQSCQSWQGAQMALSPHTFALPALICPEKKCMLSASCYLFSCRKVGSPQVRNKFREDDHFPPIELFGISSEKAFCS